MNKTAVTLTFFVLIGIAIAGGVVILLLNEAAIERFASLIVTVLGLATLGATTFYGLDKQGTKIDTIQKQTNGNLSRLQSENERLTDIIIAAGIDPQPVDLLAVPARHVQPPAVS